jgi:hypothetical protein
MPSTKLPVTLMTFCNCLGELDDTRTLASYVVRGYNPEEESIPGARKYRCIKIGNHLHVQLLLAHGHNRLKATGMGKDSRGSPASAKKARGREITGMYERLPYIKPTSAMVTRSWAL